RGWVSSQPIGERGLASAARMHSSDDSAADPAPQSEVRQMSSDTPISGPPPHGGSDAVAPLDVLIIDDEKNIRATIAMCLEEIGCRVTGAATPEAARAALASHLFDLAFLDLRLGTANGLRPAAVTRRQPSQEMIAELRHVLDSLGQRWQRDP